MSPKLSLTVTGSQHNRTAAGGQRQSAANRVFAQLSPNLLHTYGRCPQRSQLTKRIRVTAISGLASSDRYRQLVELADNSSADTVDRYVQHLDLIAVDDLRRQPLSRLQARHPLRHISRVRLRPKSVSILTTANNNKPESAAAAVNANTVVDINGLELSAHLRRRCFASVESLTADQIAASLANVDTYCDNKDLKFAELVKPIDGHTADGDEDDGVNSGRIGRIVVADNKAIKQTAATVAVADNKVSKQTAARVVADNKVSKQTAARVVADNKVSKQTAATVVADNKVSKQTAATVAAAVADVCPKCKAKLLNNITSNGVRSLRQRQRSHLCPKTKQK